MTEIRLSRFFTVFFVGSALSSALLGCSPGPAVPDSSVIQRQGVMLSGQGQLVAVKHSKSHHSFLDLESWLEFERGRSYQGVFLNISPPGSAVGAVSASPSRRDPDYFYHWVRDSALVMSVVVDLFEKASTQSDRDYLFRVVDQYANFSRSNQLTTNLSGSVGEPKYHMDGRAFLGEWGRPQNDGPALRAVTLTRFAKSLLAEGTHESYVRSKLYDGVIPGQSLIKTDLEFVSHHWQDPCFDLWEEVKGVHFYTRMVQRRALLDGAELADVLGDRSAAVWYRSQARLIEVEVLKHWDASRGYLMATTHWAGGSGGKTSGLDVAVILGVLHGSRNDGFFSPSQDMVLATAEKMRQVFQSIYSVNQIPGLGTAIGRYPEDMYDGLDVGGRPGNPWFLATAAYAELNYRLAQEWRTAGKVEVTPLSLPYLRGIMGGAALSSHLHSVGTRFERGTPEFDRLLQRVTEVGDQYLARVRYHAPSDGSLSEQFNRDNGFMQGARDLAWSYASLITAIAERQRALAH